MAERISHEGNVYSKLWQMMRDAGYSKPVNIELATVVQAPPNLRVKLDQDELILEKEDLIVTEYLTNHIRSVTLKSTNILGQTKLAGEGPHSHGYETIEIMDGTLTFENELKPGERVIIACLDEDMVYVVLDRARWYA